MLVSSGKIDCGVSCLFEKLFCTNGFEPYSESDHGFGVFAKPVGGIAFDSEIDHASDGAFDGSAANRHLLAA